MVHMARETEKLLDMRDLAERAIPDDTSYPFKR